jgi:hypothetical protein
MRKSLLFVSVMSLALGLVVQTSQADPVPWTNASGTATSFNWSNGQNATGLFGSPTLVSGNAFRFTPLGFRAQAQDGSQQLVTDTASWDVVAHAGITFSQIRLTQRGPWAITGTAPQNRVRVDGTFTATHNGLGPSAVATPSFESTMPGSGNWLFSSVVLDLSASNPTTMHISIQDDLLAISGASSTTSIQLLYSQGAVDVEIIPEPGTLVLLGMGVLGLIRRR